MRVTTDIPLSVMLFDPSGEDAVTNRVSDNNSLSLSPSLSPSLSLSLSLSLTIMRATLCGRLLSKVG